MKNYSKEKFEVICKGCGGKMILGKYQFEKGKTYCSTACRWPNAPKKERKNQQMSVEMECNYCKDKFMVRSHMAKKRIYCSAKCAADKRKDAIKECECLACGKVFKAKQSAIEAGRKYCSIECYRTHDRPEPRKYKTANVRESSDEGRVRGWAKPLPLFGLPEQKKY